MVAVCIIYIFTLQYFEYEKNDCKKMNVFTYNIGKLNILNSSKKIRLFILVIIILIFVLKYFKIYL